MKPIIPQDATQKQCAQCERWLPLTSEYFHRSTRSRIGFVHSCKECKNAPKDTSKGTFADCKTCGKSFYRRPSRQMQIHCSKECRKASEQWRPTYRQKPLLSPQPIICQQCEQTFYTKNRKRKYCSRRCATTATEEIRLGHRALDDRQCAYCQKSFHPRHSTQKYCSVSCRISNFSEDFTYHSTPPGPFREKIVEQRRTSIEAKVERCLQDLGIRYEWEQRFDRYWVDFFLPDYNLAIECDGTYWHRDKGEKDAERDAKIIEKHHIRIQRFTEEQINGNIQDLIVAVLAG